MNSSKVDKSVTRDPKIHERIMVPTRRVKNRNCLQ